MPPPTTGVERAGRTTHRSRRSRPSHPSQSSQSRPGPAASTGPEAAQTAGLRYVSDSSPGIRRRRSGNGFSYQDSRGRTIRDPGERRRIEALAIPPAWQEVWICPSPRGHLQATGRDARGRKQYRYHAEWRRLRDESKFGRMLAFGEALPRIRARVADDLARPGLPREKVLAAVVKLLETTLIRVGNEEYAKENGSFGLTTLRDGHVDISGTTLRFEFRGKSGKEHSVEIHDRRLAGVVRQCRDLPGQQLFQYLDQAGERRGVGSEDVNDYLRAVTGEDFTAKDFRTWGGTVLALEALVEAGAMESQQQASHKVLDTVRLVAIHLGNRPATCRKFYIHPAVIDAFTAGRLAGPDIPAPAYDSSGGDAPGAQAAATQLTRHEIWALALLREEASGAAA